jgi:hypothetical protein
LFLLNSDFASSCETPDDEKVASTKSMVREKFQV